MEVFICTKVKRESCTFDCFNTLKTVVLTWQIHDPLKHHVLNSACLPPEVKEATTIHGSAKRVKAIRPTTCTSNYERIVTGCVVITLVFFSTLGGKTTSDMCYLFVARG
jgi:hypothetical protein